jgi:hypothetical protein
LRCSWPRICFRMLLGARRTGRSGARERRHRSRPGIHPLLRRVDAVDLRDAYGLAGYSGVTAVLHSGLRQRLAFGAFEDGLLSLVRGALAAAISFGIAHALGPVPVKMVVGKQSLGGADSWFSRYGAYAVLTTPRARGLLRRHLLCRAHEDGFPALPRRHHRLMASACFVSSPASASTPLIHGAAARPIRPHNRRRGCRCSGPASPVREAGAVPFSGRLSASGRSRRPTP